MTLEKIKDLYKRTQYDPGLFDSLAVEYKYKYNNSSGVYPLSTEQNIPQIILKNLKETPPNTISYPFETEHQSICLVYLYEKTDIEFPTLTNSWEQLEQMAKNEKMNNKFLTWIDEKSWKNIFKNFEEVNF